MFLYVQFPKMLAIWKFPNFDLSLRSRCAKIGHTGFGNLSRGYLKPTFDPF